MDSKVAPWLSHYALSSLSNARSLAVISMSEPPGAFLAALASSMTGLGHFIPMASIEIISDMHNTNLVGCSELGANLWAERLGADARPELSCYLRAGRCQIELVPPGPSASSTTMRSGQPRARLQQAEPGLPSSNWSTSPPWQFRPREKSAHQGLPGQGFQDAC